jgi:hypothetical protein
MYRDTIVLRVTGCSVICCVLQASGGSCRVLAYNTHLQTMCVSQQSTNTLFPGYGVKMVLDSKC